MTSLPFSDMLCATAKATTHIHQVTSAERREVSDQLQRQKRCALRYYGELGVVLGWVLKWFCAAYSHWIEAPGSTGAHPDLQRERQR